VSFVDYDRAARRYDAGRGLSDDTLECWRRAVVARVEPAGCTVLDVGAGTGVFAAAWMAWGARAVVGVEPSEAMRRQAAGRAGAGVAVVGGRAEALPLAPSSVDVVWMSAVLHHLSDRERGVRELSRVLRPGGHVLVRGYVPDRSRVPWLDALPGAARARARFPGAADVARTFGAQGLALRDAVEVAEPHRHSRGDAASWIERMREADSLLTALAPVEIDAGVAALRTAPDELLEPLALTLLTFRLEG
jgi:SAM-dependent methyltransferase